jgi:hypothetical protein
VVNLNENRVEFVKGAFISLGIFGMALPAIIKLNVHCSSLKHNE